MEKWGQDRLMSIHIRRDHHETDFMSQLDAAYHRRVSWPIYAMFFLVIALVVSLIAWASLSQIEEITRGQGSVVPSQDIQIVQSLEGGVVQEILVKEGQAVKKGQTLLRISDVLFSSQERGVEARLFALEAQKSRLRAEIDGTAFSISKDMEARYPDIVASERDLFASRQQELKGGLRLLDDRVSKAAAEISEANAQISRLGSSSASLKEEIEITKGLVASRAVPKLEEMRLTREYNDILGQISAQKQRKRALEAERRAASNEKDTVRDRYRSGALSELSKVEAELSALQEELTSIEDRVDRTDVRSPVDGVVNRLTINTVGGVLEPAQPLAEIVPMGSDLKIIAQIRPEEIGFMKPGLPVKIKLSAYDSQIYGALEGWLVRVGANSITDGDGNIFFEIEVVADKNYLGDREGVLPVLPGMVGTVEIITGKRTILHYLMKPLLRARSVALTER